MMMQLRADPNGSTPLHTACLKGNTAIAKLLLQHKAAVDVADSDGLLPLHVAALTGNPDLVTLLLDYGAAMNAAMPATGDTPLHIAASWGRTAAVRQLLERVAATTTKNRKGHTPLDAARSNHHAAIADLLEKVVIQ